MREHTPKQQMILIYSTVYIEGSNVREAIPILCQILRRVLDLTTSTREAKELVELRNPDIFRIFRVLAGTMKKILTRRRVLITRMGWFQRAVPRIKGMHSLEPWCN